MREQTGRQVGAVTNAVLVLLLAVVPFATDGTRIDHTEVRPWGCRSCPIPPQPPGAPLREDPGLGPVEADRPGPPADGSSVMGAAAAGPTPTAPGLVCGDSCPAVVELLVAACAACPSA